MILMARTPNTVVTLPPAPHRAREASARTTTPPLPLRVQAHVEGKLVLDTVLQESRVYVVGRGAAADLGVVHAAVSRVHGVLRFDVDRGWEYLDSHSSNGTWAHRVDGAPTPARAIHNTRVRSGDALCVGTEDVVLHFDGVAPAGPSSGVPHGVAESAAARELDAAVERLARTDTPVFILGPSGSGKTHTARQLHARRAGAGPFHAVNCAALPADATALHALFLGHVRGAYTGAVGEQEGLLFMAHQGTLFLDEIESLPANAQGFLLDALEGQGDFCRLGSRAARKPPRFRLVTASKLPLAHTGLRPDLGYRLLAGESLAIPSLAARRADIPGFMDRFAGDERPVPVDGGPAFRDDAYRWAREQAWPGELRQLASVVGAAVRVSSYPVGQGPLEAAAQRYARALGEDSERTQLRRIPPGALQTGDASAPSTPSTPSTQLMPHASPAAFRATAGLGPEDLKAALQLHGGNKARAARHLGVALNTFKRKMQKFGL